MSSYLEQAQSLVKRLEGCVLHGYRDSVGVATNGYGHTGPEVVVGQEITQEIADHNLLVDLGIADSRLKARVKPAALAALTDHERAALLSFVFNLGANPKWTIWSDLNAGRLDDVPAQMMRFVNAGGRQLPGLVKRRQAEGVYYRTADIGAAAQAIMVQEPEQIAPSSSVTRETMDTPPTPLPPKPLAATSLATKVTGCVAACGVAAAHLSTQASTAAQQVLSVVQPHADVAPIFATVVTILTGVVVVTGVVSLFISHHQETVRTH